MIRTKTMARMAAMVVLGWACWVHADAKDDARERRKARRSQVEQLVQAGQASEGANGYLVAKPGLDAAQTALVQAENADRKIGYAAIAQAHGKTVEEVGKKAAEINQAKAAKK